MNPVAAIEQNLCFGVSVGDTVPAVVRASLGGELDRRHRIGSRPLCALLGGLQGERAVAEPLAHIDSRGTGWWRPLAAAVSPSSGAARFPVPLAWTLLDRADPAVWFWRPDGVDGRIVRLEPEIAIGLGVAELLRTVEAHPHHPVAVVVPNTTELQSQDALLRGLMRARVQSPSLLWRPIAAALAWLDSRAAHLDETSDSESQRPPTLWTIHLGISEFEICCLELVVREFKNRQFILPARGLPRLPSLRARGLHLIETAARYPRWEDHVEYARLWRRIWASNELSSCLGAAASPMEPKQVQNSCAAATRAVIAAEMGVGSEDDHSHGIGQADIGPMTLQGLPEHPLSRPDLWMSGGEVDTRAWLQKINEILSDEHNSRLTGGLDRAAGVIVTGDLAPILIDDRTFAEVVVDCLFGPRRHPEAQIERFRQGILAQGAMLYADRRARGEPTYLDTLPRLETLVVRQGEPQWIDLLKVEDRYVPGGEEWRREEDDSGLAIASGERELRLSLWREGHPTTKAASLAFGEESTEVTPVRTRIRMTSGQGHPRFEVEPISDGLLGGGRAVLDWRRAEDTGKTKEQEQQDIPRTNPPLEPRLASRRCWYGGLYSHDDRETVYTSARKLITAISGSMRKITDQSAADLEAIRHALRANDGEFVRRSPPDHATAVGSNGQIDAGEMDMELLHGFIREVDELLGTSLALNVQAEIFRILGYCSASESQAPRSFDIARTFLSAVRREAPLARFPRRDAVLTSIGSCFRDPEDVKLLLEVAAIELQRNNSPNNWMRATARILQYRKDALRDTPSELALHYLEECHHRLEAELQQQKAAYIYRHSAITIVYLLRRRRYDDSFLNPNSNPARQIKKTFNDAIMQFQANMLSTVGGFVNLASVTQMMIDYIDRRGRGRLVGVGIE